MTLHVTFVCTYNVARSVMAAAMFSEELRRRGLADSVRVSSAGMATHRLGAGADRRTVRVLDAHGYLGSATHRVEQIGAEHLTHDMIVAMDRGHIRGLQDLGVGPSRLFLMDVRNPESTNDFEEAFAVINDCLPDLLDILEENLRPIHVGWRFWLVYRDEVFVQDDAVLCPPIAVLDTQKMLPKWLSKRFEADCVEGHKPPARDCTCGVYTDCTFEQSYGRMRLWQSAYRTAARSVSGHGLEALMPIGVLGKVALSEAVLCPPLNGVGGTPGLRPSEMPANHREIRAASAEILELHVYDDRPPAGIAALLEKRYQARVSVQRCSQAGYLDAAQRADAAAAIAAQAAAR